MENWDDGVNWPTVNRRVHLGMISALAGRRRRLFQQRTFALILFCLLSSASVVHAATRVALVSTCGGNSAGDVLALAEASLSADTNVVLVERAEVERILNEQKLVHCGLSDSAQALAVGKLLGVQVFATLETFPDSKEVSGMVAFNASTGVRLLDATLTGTTIEDKVRAIADGMRSALAKYQRKTGDVRTVCLITVRNADLPRELDGFCDSVGRLLEQSLIGSPEIAVLERARLEQVNQERTLPTDSPLPELLSSLVRIELEVSRADDGTGLRGIALLSSGSGQLVSRSPVTVARRDAAALARELTLAIQRSLKTAPDAVEVDRTKEARRFLRESEFLLSHGDSLHALSAAEAAYALAPEDKSIANACGVALITHGLGLSGSNRNNGLKLVQRGSEICLSVNRRIRADSQMLDGETTVSSDPFTGLLSQVSELKQPPDRWPDESVPALEAISDNFRSEILEENRVRFAASTTKRANAWRSHSIRLAWFLQWPELWSRSSHQWVDDMLNLVIPWVKNCQQVDHNTQIQLYEIVISCPFAANKKLKLVEADYDRLNSLWTAMEQNPDGIVQLYGQFGRISAKIIQGKTPDETLRADIRAFRSKLQEHLLSDQGDTNKAYRDAADFLLGPWGKAINVLTLETEKNEFRKFLASLSATTNAPAITVTPWHSARELLDVIQAETGTEIIFQPLVSGGIVYTIAGGENSDRTQFIQLLSFSIPDGQKTPLGKMTLEPGWGSRRGHPNSFATSSCLGDGRYFLGTEQQGIFAFPLGGGEVERIDKAVGLPSDSVQSIACLDGKLYAVLNGGYLIVYDLRSRQCKTLVSSRRLEKLSPFDNNNLDLAAPCMAADPEHERILFLSRTWKSPDDPKHSLRGIWAIDAKDGRLERVVAPESGDDNPEAWPNAIRNIYAYPPEMMKETNIYVKFLMVVGPDRESFPPQCRNLQAAIQGQPGSDGNVVDKKSRWIWSATWDRTWQRHSVDKQRAEFFPPLRKDGFEMNGEITIQFIDKGRYALVGDQHGLWLLTLAEESNETNAK